LSFIVYRSNRFEDKIKRQVARESLKEEKSGWGFIHYGNSGDVEFVDPHTSIKKLDIYDRIKYDDEI
jgi:hypothetical protein